MVLGALQSGLRVESCPANPGPSGCASVLLGVREGKGFGLFPLLSPFSRQAEAWHRDGPNCPWVEVATRVGKPTGIWLQRVVVFIGLWLRSAQSGEFSFSFGKRAQGIHLAQLRGTGAVQAEVLRSRHAAAPLHGICPGLSKPHYSHFITPLSQFPFQFILSLGNLRSLTSSWKRSTMPGLMKPHAR